LAGTGKCPNVTCVFEVAVEAHDISFVQGDDNFCAIVLLEAKFNAIRQGEQDTHNAPVPGSIHMPVLSHQFHAGETVHERGSREHKMRERPRYRGTARQCEQADIHMPTQNFSQTVKHMRLKHALYCFDDGNWLDTVLPFGPVSTWFERELHPARPFVPFFIDGLLI